MSKQKIHTAELYAEQVMSGEVLVCEFVRLAVERYYNDLEMALYHDMMSDIEKEGVTIEVETKNGTVMQINPKRKIAEGALSSAKMLATEFGMTPSSRSRVSAILNGNEQKDEFAEFEEVDE